MPNEIGNPTPQPLIIPMDKIHEMPGVFTPRPPERSLGGLITSIQSGGIKEPVILRQREDGEYQLVSGFRAVKVQFPVFLTVPVIHRNAVGIVIIPQQ